MVTVGHHSFFILLQWYILNLYDTTGIEESNPFQLFFKHPLCLVAGAVSCIDHGVGEKPVHLLCKTACLVHAYLAFDKVQSTNECCNSVAAGCLDSCFNYVQRATV